MEAASYDTLPRLSHLLRLSRLAVLYPFSFFLSPTTLVLLILLTTNLQAQRRDKLDRANREFTAGDYPGAIRTLQSVKGLEGDAEGSLLLAVSRFHANDLLGAEADLLALAEREKDDLPLVWFYLGRIYHTQHRFARAAREYKRYLRTLGDDGAERKTVVNLLRNVDNGVRAGYVTDQMVAENMGPRINSENDEFGPVPSPLGTGKLYFSLVRPQLGTDQQQSDIVVSSNGAAGWGTPTSLNPYLNTAAQESLLDISADGQKLYYFRGNGGRAGRFLVDTFRANSDQLVTLEADAPLTAGTDATPFFGAPDAVYFASRRPGGYGGLDLYRCRRLPNGTYAPAENLGPGVNGPYDEITPFVANDGRTLYFSTNDPRLSVGGFDVVRSYRVVGAEGQFTQAENAGMPVNSASDDTHFRLANDTFTGFLCSDRKDGLGRRDLYVVFYVEAREEMR